ncbi:protein disulfide-isomerase domain [Candidozyma pseudohaemuli]|uniref:Protein disulfide-isomerase domain n=1 Tax=Candidozyma pseudohaemuli TaxID=418784 RepID=A0A2P7YQS8_9ASCO|nr:protein disulfide-isomerase domain [[Candida] pseudohaemulonii]PSK38284.1 protein disulfide-isomerase domain [[Candida] pseudohaemulonii]
MLSVLRLWILTTLLLVVASRELGDVYANDPNVYELTPLNFDKVVHRSNYTSIVKFYAPWCGYCKQLLPVWHKLGKFLHKEGKYGVHVAAVNCDKESNKPLCAAYRVQGFPTLMLFRPPKYAPGKARANLKHVPEPYNGQRSLKAITDYVSTRIKNYVDRIHGLKGLPEFLEGPGPRVVLLLKNTNISPVYKTMAIDFLSKVSFGYLKTDVAEPASVTVDGKKVQLPIEEGDTLPILLFWDSEKGEFSRYLKGKLTNKHEMEAWVQEQTGVKPSEGGLSKKDKKYYAKYRGERVHDEL